MSEHDNQSAVVNWFKLQYPKYKDCIMAIPNGQLLGGRNKFALIKKLKREGFKNGVSDLFIAVPMNGKCGLWVEMKDAGKTRCSVSSEQQAHLDLMISVGYEGIWAAGSDIAIAAIKVYMTEAEL
tara:strand:+ start:44 stop:418 length:375 start_codon:yes stop_codon:yes gene_type:complete